MSVTPEVRKPPLIWANALMFALTFAAAAVLVPWYGLRYGFSGADFAVALFFLFANGMSVTAGYHRLWAHRTYEAHLPVRIFYLIFGTMALQNSAFAWCSGHRTHHLHVDDVDLDPYSARRGFWFSHIGWMLREYPSGVPDFSNIPDLKKDRLLAFQHRYYVPLAVGLNFGLPILAGLLFHDFWGMLILAGVLRLVWSHHVTFFINSLAHMWGTRPYTDDNTARDNPALAVITYGEGYHNFRYG
jgi:stearoyl-CoA desaturase (Delta-9 desaturase)